MHDWNKSAHFDRHLSTSPLLEFSVRGADKKISKLRKFLSTKYKVILTSVSYGGTDLGILATFHLYDKNDLKHE